MFYMMTRSSLDEEWKPFSENSTDLSFQSRNEASDAAALLAIGSVDHYMVVDEKGKFASLIYAGKNPYRNLL